MITCYEVAGKKSDNKFYYKGDKLESVAAKKGKTIDLGGFSYQEV